MIFFIMNITMSHFQLLVAINPQTVYKVFFNKKKDNDKTLGGFFSLDSVGNTYGNNTIPDDCGFIWFLNTAYSYVRSLKKKKEKLRYQKVFGEENKQLGTERFPLMISDEKVFIQQQEGYNCGIATVLHIADFYIYRLQRQYPSNGQDMSV